MPQTTTYGYDAHGNIVKKTMPNGETITQSYDALNRVTKIEGQKPSDGGLLYRYGYRYDLAGNIVFIREDYSESPASWREIQQTYDRAHRLISEQYTYSPDGILGTDEGNRIISYRYDEADNRTQKSIFRFSEQEDYSYNTLNQLTHLGADERAVDYEYDLNGNRMLRTEDTTLTGYAYDYDNRLVTVTNESLDPVYAYTYDYRTRRVAIEATAEAPASGTTTLSFSGGTSVQEYSGSTLNVEYIRGSDLGGGIGGILYTIRGGDPSFTHYNSRGDVVAKTDNGSTLTYQAAYEAYGTRSDEAGSTLDRQKANTKDEDPTGLLNEGFRYRDLETGEFITRDPAGFVDGPNLYTYVRQNPWTKFDPVGLIQMDAAGNVIMKDAGDPEIRTFTKGNVVEKRWAAQPVQMKTDDGRVINGYVNLDRSQPECDANCHGVSFAGGKVWIQGKDVPTLLKGDGYEKTQDPSVGDIAIYKDPTGFIEHSGTVASVDPKTKDVKVTSKDGPAKTATTAPATPGPGGAWPLEDATLEYYKQPPKPSPSAKTTPSPATPVPATPGPTKPSPPPPSQATATPTPSTPAPPPAPPPKPKL